MVLDFSAKSNNVMHTAKKSFLQTQLESRAETTLKFLVEEYEQYASSLFIQEYAQEFAIVLRNLKNEQYSKEYEQMLLVLLMENYRSNICALQYKFAYVISHINEALAYWSVQQNNPVLYTLHKNPIKWFNNELSVNEIQRHIQALEEIEHQYMLTLGQLIHHTTTFPLDINELSYELMMKLSQELRVICGDVVQEIVEINENEHDNHKSFFKAIYMLSLEQNNIVENLLKSVEEHEKPHHVERFWLQYAVGVGLIIFLIKQKNNPASGLNHLMKKYDLITHEKRFIESCKQNFVLPFQRLGNTLFGFPLDIQNNYPAKFEPLVKSYNKANADSNELAAEKYNTLPKNAFDIAISIPYRQPNLKENHSLVTSLMHDSLTYLKNYLISTYGKFSIPDDIEWSDEQLDLLLKTNKVLGYLLYMVLRGKADMILSFLNMTHEIDLMLKMIASIPAIALLYGGYKGIQHLWKCGSYAHYKLLYTALIDVKQCIVEASLEKENTNKDTNDYICGKLFFLKYRVKKIAAKLFSKSVYKAFAKDIKKIKWTENHSGDYAKMLSVIMKKYNIKQRANA
jgi:hypothetical protein